MKSSLHSILIFFIAVFSVILYATTLSNGFVYDDIFTITNNSFIKDLSNLPKLLSKDYTVLSTEMTYRPIVTLTYFIEYALYGLKPWGFHLTNVLLHALNGIVLYIFLMHIFQQDIKGRRNLNVFIITLLFISNPVLTEAVNAISYREDLLVFLFYILTLLLFIKYKSLDSIPLYLLSCVTFFLALLSKEMAITLPLMICSYEILYGKEKILRRIIFSYYNLGYLLVIMTYAYLRFFYFYSPIEAKVGGWSLIDKLLTIPWLLSNYIKLALFPFSLSANYVVYPVKSVLTIPFILSISVLIGLVALAYRMREHDKHITFGVLFYLIALIPVYNLMTLMNPFAERYFYLPAVGFAIVTVSLILKLLESEDAINNRKILLVFAIIGLYGVLTGLRSPVWKDQYTLWSDTIKKSPNSARSHSNLGVTYLTQGRIDDAIQEFKIAVKLKPDWLRAQFNLGKAYHMKGEVKEAIGIFLNVLKSHPESTEARHKLGQAFYFQNRMDEAIQEYKAALEINHILPDVHNDLGVIYAKNNNLDDAVDEFLTAIKQKPDHADAFYNLANAYSAKGRYDEAITEYRRSLRFNPDSVEAHYNLGNAYKAKGLSNLAKMEFEEVARLQPDNKNAINEIDLLR